MKIIPEIAEVKHEIQVICRDIHAHPELCYEENGTANIAWGIEVMRGLGKTGVIGLLRNESSRKMHPCGHDGDTAMLLGAAEYRARHRNFDGTVVFIFQPAEEGGAGAKAMIEDGLFHRFPVDIVFAMHNWPGMATGDFGVRSDATQASGNQFWIRVKGAGTHAAYPHYGIDPDSLRCRSARPAEQHDT
jgi:metal-dependent amidase/aminoacylase/carboxypeptidase family protein